MRRTAVGVLMAVLSGVGGAGAPTATASTSPAGSSPAGSSPPAVTVEPERAAELTAALVAPNSYCAMLGLLNRLYYGWPGTFEPTSRERGAVLTHRAAPVLYAILSMDRTASLGNVPQDEDLQSPAALVETVAAVSAKLADEFETLKQVYAAGSLDSVTSYCAVDPASD